MILSKKTFHLFPIKSLPIFNKYSILKTKQIKPLSTYHKVCLAYVIPHGMTDLFLYSGEITNINYVYNYLFYSIYPARLKYLLLCLFSLYHLRNDIRGPLFIKIMYSIGIHVSWIIYPEWSITYLAWIHTTLHYLALYKLLNNLSKLILLFSSIMTFMVLNYKNINDCNKEGLWIPLVIAHVINIS